MEVVRRVLPRGPADFAAQLLIWFGFVFSYQLVRGLPDHDRGPALANGMRIVDLERHLSRPILELRVQHLFASTNWLATAAAWTYWNAEFTVVGLALLWVYLRKNEHFARLRNAVILASALALIGFTVDPTAPPRMFPSLGFHDTLAGASGLNHGSGLVQLAGNPYAAMPSLHSANALIVGLVLATACRRRWAKALWLLWPVWVWTCVIATANHFLLDVVAGIALALLTLGALELACRR
jgi:membrane-associated phospholipid phosphatase